jgi:hypothetical protein
VPGGTAELTVGDVFEAYFFLTPDDIADGLVFDAAQIGLANAAGFFVFASLEQLGRPEQATYVISAEGRGLDGNHFEG